MDSFRVLQTVFHADGWQGDGFTVETADGWMDGVDMRREEIMLPRGHGAFDVPGFLSPRVLSLSGMCQASSRGQFRWLRSQLTGLLADGSSSQVVGDLDSVVAFGNAGLASKTQFQPVVWGALARYQIQFWFANPRLFGETRTFASGAATVHYGNFPAAPVHTVSGAHVGGYTINGPDGKSFVVTADVVSGHPHVIDMATGFLSIDGVVQNGVVSQADTWAIPGGATVIHTLTGAGLTLSTSVTDTYI